MKVIPFLYCALTASAFQLFSQDSVSDFPDACGTALIQNVSCPDMAPRLDPYDAHPPDILQQACVSSCGQALDSWYTQVSSACDGVTYVDADRNASLSDVVGRIAYRFNSTCAQDSGQYCNTYFQNASQAAALPCSGCGLRRLGDAAGDPFDGSRNAIERYSSYTSSCGGDFTNHPLPTRAATSNSSNAVPTAPACSSPYAIRGGDSCDSIASSQGTATNWLLMDNNLQAHCANFPSNGSLCIDHPCKPYKVKAGDTCASIASANNISPVQLRVFNPWIDGTCYNINSTIDTQICISQPGTAYVAPDFNNTMPPATAAPVPDNIAPNTTNNCANYYLVALGDYCSLLSMRFGIALPDFYILNQGVDANCSNLLANSSYCVQPVGSMDNYPGSPFYGLSNSTQTPAPDFSSFGNATYQPLFPLIPPGPLAPGSATGCDEYRDGSDLQYGYPDNSDCAAAAIYHILTLAELQVLNPSLQTNASDCTFLRGFSYCFNWGNYTEPDQPDFSNTTDPSTNISASATASNISSIAITLSSSSSFASASSSSSFFETTSLTSTSLTSTSVTSSSGTSASKTTSAVATPTNLLPRNCNSFAAGVPLLGCVLFALQHGLTLSTLNTLNAKILTDPLSCLLKTDITYCVGVAIPKPVQSGIPVNCDLYAQASIGDTCDSFAQKNSIASSQLFALNSVLGASGEKCGSNFKVSTYYCIGTYSK